MINKYSFLNRLFPIIIMGIIILYPFIFFGCYAGDAEIHLIYGENAAQGHFFEFNKYEKSAGVTSPGWMILLAFLFKIFPAFEVPLIIKLFNIITWYVLVLLYYFIAKAILKNEHWVLFSTLLVGILPGSVYNATIGMENGFFALLLLLFSYLLIKYDFFDNFVNLNNKTLIICSIVLGISTLIRPEGLIIEILFLGFVLFLYRKKGILHPNFIKNFFVCFFSYLFSIQPVYIFHYLETGYLIPTSAIARIIMGSANENIFGLSIGVIELGPVIINMRVLLLLIFYLPLTITWLIGLYAIFIKKQNLDKINIIIFFNVIFITFFILYSSLIGGSHTSRYIIFILPFFILVSTIGCTFFWERIGKSSLNYKNFLKNALLILFILLIAGIFIFETGYRTQSCSSNELKSAQMAPLIRENLSKNMLEILENPNHTPISLAYQEVQIRYWLNDSFIIRSLDGRVDPDMLYFIKNNNYDHLGYIKYRNINFIMETTNYNKDKKLWSLENLQQLNPNEEVIVDGIAFKNINNSVIVDGIVFKRINKSIYSVEQRGDNFSVLNTVIP